MLLLGGCSKSPYDGMREGKVVYDLKLEGEEIPLLLDVMMPSEATVWFSEGKSVLVMDGAAGSIKFRVISDPEKGVYASLVSVMGQKSAVLANPDSVKAFSSKKNSRKIHFTGNTKTLAGLECREAIVSDTLGNVFKVFFTNELDVTTPNWGMAFAEIDGLMMEYGFEMDGLKMHLKAKKVTADKPD
ncbi:MAG: hypothetical protein ACKOYC_01660, partial [Bacteroidota bacterium]